MSNNVGSYTGIVGIPNPTRRYTQWHIREVYGLGGSVTNVHIPNIDDTVIDLMNNRLYRVISLSSENIPTLELVQFTGVSGVGRTDTILGTGPGLCSEGYRIYVNNKIIPHPCFIDNRLIIPGSENSYIKIFKGYDVSDDKAVVSGVFNSAKRMVSENIPLENVVIPHYPSNTYKVAVPAHLTETLEDGEVVTVVVYTSAGSVSLRFTLLVVNTEFVRNIDASKKHVTDISLITPYISDSDNLLVEIPLSMTTNSASFMGRVSYSDGSSTTYPVDGDKFTLHGFDTYVASRVGDNLPAILRYALSSTENASIIQTVDGKQFMNKQYSIKTVESDSRYSIKLFVLPAWDNVGLKWVLNYWLYSLSRDTVIDVTRFVESSVNSIAFDGRLFGSAQRLVLAFNIDNLGPSYSYYRHVETIEVTLNHPVTSSPVSSYYEIKYDNDSIVGAHVIARVSGPGNNYTLDLSNGFGDGNALVSRWYHGSSPLVYPFNEDRAPFPTHARIIIGTWSREVLISELALPITGVTAAIGNGTHVQVEFVRVSHLSRLELGKVALVARMS